MTLVTPGYLFSTARERGFAIGYFESWDITSLQGVIDAAETAQAPVVIGFNGDFLSGGSRVAQEQISWYAALGRAAAESAKVPCAFIFNECPRDDWVLAAVDAGFNLVMPVDPDATHADYRQRVKRVVDYAHARDVAVEAEMDELPCGASGTLEGEALLTDVDKAVSFADETGVDLLAVSVGNVHISVSGQYGLDFAHLEELASRVKPGLVLHGGTGIPAADLRRAASMGVVKVNFGTYMKQAWLKTMRSALGVDEINPHELLGLGGKHDVLVKARLAVRDAVIPRMESLGSVGKAFGYKPLCNTAAK